MIDEKCWKCGKKLQIGLFCIELVDGGTPRRYFDPPADEADPGYMGWFLVGGCYAKGLRKS